MIADYKGKHLHFIGIGGYGMSGLAGVLQQRGIRISGCDARANSRTRRLEDMGVPVREGHRASHLDDVDAVVFSTDVPADNPELAAARERGIQLLHRSQVLGSFLNAGHGIAVTGTHGKTTITALLGLTLKEAGLDPTIFVGGDVPDFGGTAVSGSGKWVVAEACESDRTFLRYTPFISVVTNIEPEHLDHYDGDEGLLVESFRKFIVNTLPGGIAILCSDDTRLLQMASSLKDRTIRTYGTGVSAALRAASIRAEPGGTRWELRDEGQVVGQLEAPLLGHHNVLNATAVAAVCLELGVDLCHLQTALSRFHGVERRFQVVSKVGDVTVVSDYAHHPTEIRATLDAARQTSPGRLIAVFQPQRYVRTHNLWQGFASAFARADEVVLTEIYAPVGEDPIPGINGRALAGDVESESQRPTTFLPTLEEVIAHLQDRATAGDMILVMGAGDIWKVAHQLGREFEKERAM